MKKIKLTQKTSAIVDDEDYDKLIVYNWQLQKRSNTNSYAIRTRRYGGHKHTIHMHAVVLNAPQGKIIDHINGNGLDNRKCNLRFATSQTNAFNKCKPNVPCTSKYKGVLRRHGRGKWIARIKYNDRHLELGKYDTEEKAASVYNFASRIMFGVYRRENVSPKLQELSREEKWSVYKKCKRYIEKYGWYIDTEVYHSFFMIDKEME